LVDDKKSAANKTRVLRIEYRREDQYHLPQHQHRSRYNKNKTLKLTEKNAQLWSKQGKIAITVTAGETGARGWRDAGDCSSDDGAGGDDDGGVGDGDGRAGNAGGSGRGPMDATAA